MVMNVFAACLTRLGQTARLVRVGLVVALVAGLLPASPAGASPILKTPPAAAMAPMPMADSAPCPHHAQAALAADHGPDHQAPGHPPGGPLTKKPPMPGLLCCVAALPGGGAPALVQPVALGRPAPHPALKAPPGASASFPPFRPPSL